MQREERGVLARHLAVGLASAMRAFGRRKAAFLLSAAAPIALAALVWPLEETRFDPPDDYTLPAYAQQFEEYRGNPFAPTYARTDDLRMVAPELLAGSASCGRGGCHEQRFNLGARLVACCQRYAGCVFEVARLTEAASA